MLLFWKPSLTISCLYKSLSAQTFYLLFCLFIFVHISMLFASKLSILPRNTIHSYQSCWKIHNAARRAEKENNEYEYLSRSDSCVDSICNIHGLQIWSAQGEMIKLFTDWWCSPGSLCHSTGLVHHLQFLVLCRHDSRVCRGPLLHQGWQWREVWQWSRQWQS